ncbi:unnamed protein product [Lymnaea stagnalis]|uniref:SEA domain-containing protein n=1 Tax=Lymnaea stagnalis TaxID=6523 RepID=A0AAV2HIQ6_LYMST
MITTAAAGDTSASATMTTTAAAGDTSASATTTTAAAGDTSASATTTTTAAAGDTSASATMTTTAAAGDTSASATTTTTAAAGDTAASTTTTSSGATSSFPSNETTAAISRTTVASNSTTESSNSTAESSNSTTAASNSTTASFSSTTVTVPSTKTKDYTLNVKIDKDVSNLNITEKTSQDYKDLKALVESSLFTEFSKSVKGLDKVEVEDMRSGSLIVDFRVIVDTEINPDADSSMVVAVVAIKTSLTIGNDTYNVTSLTYNSVVVSADSDLCTLLTRATPCQDNEKCVITSSGEPQCQ